MAEDSDLEKTEQATPKRIEKAREEGDVPRSKELAACVGLFAAGLYFLMLQASLGNALTNTLKQGLSFDRSIAFDANKLLLRIADIIVELVIAFLPYALLIVFVSLAAPIAVGGWNFTSKALMPKFSKLNPLKGLKNMVSKNALIELIKSIGKALLVGGVSYWVIADDIQPILDLNDMPIEHSIGEVNTLMINGFLIISSTLVFIALIDVPYQLHHYANKLKMTKEEVKKEAKESEGNPEIKSRIRQQQREMARNRMMASIPDADVVITNPTHYAVAIQYKDNNMQAPVVVAKGADAVALKIREIAQEHQVTTVESPKLARAIYAHTELEQEIPEALYNAVAQILAYVFQLRTGRDVDLPEDLPVPDALDPHSLMPAPNLLDEEVNA